MKELRTDVLVVGGGLGGVAAALAATEHGAQVVLTEGPRWLGGQLTAQATPPDEHPWVEMLGVTASYRSMREGIRGYYRRHYPLTAQAMRARQLNPGAGLVSRLCHEPRVAVAVLESMLAPARSSGRLTVLRPYRAESAAVDGDTVTAVTLVPDGDTVDGPVTVHARYVIDATETGDLLPLAGAEYVTGAESRNDTGEPSAKDTAEPLTMQAVSWCFAVDHVDGDHTIDRPAAYDHWRSVRPAVWPGPLLAFSWPNPRTLEPSQGWLDPNPDDDPLAVEADQSKDAGTDDLWRFRRIAARRLFEPGAYASDITLVNWPMIDYMDGPLFEVSADEAAKHRAGARELALSALYWMQTEAPRPDGGTGFPSLRLRGDLLGTDDGLAQDVYVRESRRIRAVTTVREDDVSLAIRGEHGATRYRDSVGIGMYRIDLHPSTGGDTYLDVASAPFQIPLGALLPQRMVNLLPAAKNIGTTHITNGAYRLHPVEWNIGEAAGALAAHCVTTGRTPHGVHATPDHLDDYRSLLSRRGIPLAWPEIRGY
ncbi:FAD-dependent oxidoreductase [Actinacidiphila bryophytorum]|uniref:FAD dependent oxidoreductase n=1 Tax=Actinacidiphila bryophytorum TaxID=1436133 RepID=A0A9W4H2W4_9ACTN|nr:FAD-dependent oxidoreductase [Actinacidiphila bryophytorum]MBM9437003.1 FAD-dependent oxidoreductase [Actinacidiphila bryophytorum]MBN6544711.1 FAD-dependent oxidoreductase [Actinacidiphila bryophytorum]CAG7646188.1 FAD dependent oxidoreductase [Actinacidiphila bryophytorum]